MIGRYDVAQQDSFLLNSISCIRMSKLKTIGPRLATECNAHSLHCYPNRTVREEGRLRVRPTTVAQRHT